MKARRITIVGTSYPMRGGIAHFVGLWWDALRKRGHDARVVSFSRQYPSLLFPGKTQFEEGKPDIDPHAAALIDSVNPLSWFRAARHIIDSNADVALFKYWIPFFAPCYGVIARRLRKAGVKVVYLCDNITPHEKRPGDTALTKFVLSAADGFIVLSDVVERDLLGYCPDARYVKLLHPLYESFGSAIDRTEAKKRLGAGKKPTILFFGYIRRYKGLDILLNAMPEVLASLPDATLLVAGEVYGDENEYHALVKNLGLEEHVSLNTAYVSSERVAEYFSAADIVVLPYRSATQSGIVQIAYHFGRACIVTDVGGLSEVVLNERTGFVVAPENVHAISGAIIKFFREQRQEAFERNVNDEKKKYSWEMFAEQTESLLEKIIGNEKPHQ